MSGGVSSMDDWTNKISTSREASEVWQTVTWKNIIQLESWIKDKNTQFEMR